MNGKRGLSRIMSALLAASSMIGGVSARRKKVVKKANSAGVVLDSKKNRRRNRGKKADFGVGTVSSSKSTSKYSFWKDPRSYGEAILGLSTLGLGTAAIHYRNESDRRVNDVISFVNGEINKRKIFRDLLGKLEVNEQNSLINSGFYKFLNGFELSELERGGESVDWSDFVENQDGVRKFDSVVFNFEDPYNEGDDCKYRFEVTRCRKVDQGFQPLSFKCDEDGGKIKTDHCWVAVYKDYSECSFTLGNYYFTFDDGHVIESIASAVAESIYITDLNRFFNPKKAIKGKLHQEILTNIWTKVIMEGDNLKFLHFIGGDWVQDAVLAGFKCNSKNLKVAKKIFVGVLNGKRDEKIGSIQGGK